MKPSERIEELRHKLISDDWVAFGGQTVSVEAWTKAEAKNPVYILKAIIAYLDEEAQTR